MMSVKYRFVGFVLLAAPLLVWRLAVAAQSQQSANSGFDYAVFKNPPAEYRPDAMPVAPYDRCTATEALIISSVQDLAKQSYGGFSRGGSLGRCGTNNLAGADVRATGGRSNVEGIEYLSDGDFKLYKVAVEEAKKNGLSVMVFVGALSANGLLYTKYPQYAAKSLDMVEKDVTGPAKADLAIPEGTYVGAVMMNRDTFERVDVSDRRAEGSRLVCQVPKGNWKVMAFYLKYGGRAVVDYLDEAAMNAYLSLECDQFYAHLKEYFGNVINKMFYDEPAMHKGEGRMWTPAFNQNFEKKYGYSPMKYYPALWYDIGPETAAARNALYGFRAQLWAENFIGKLNKWCDDHGIQLTGHMDMEEDPNPVPVNGDLMKTFQYQDIPGVDDIWFLGRSNTSYKVVTSSAFNYDKPVVMAETYAAYYKLDKKIAFQVAMDQSAMGVNFHISEYLTRADQSACGLQPRRTKYHANERLRGGGESLPGPAKLPAPAWPPCGGRCRALSHRGAAGLLQVHRANERDQYPSATDVAVRARGRRGASGDRLHGRGRDAVSCPAGGLHLPSP